MKKLFFFIIAYLPFQLALNISSGVDLASGRIFILLLFFIYLIESIKNKRINLKINLLDFWLASFFFFMSLSLLVSKNYDWSFRKLAFIFSFWPIYFLSRHFLRDKENILRVSKLLVGSAFAISLLALGQFFSQFVFGLDAVYGFWSHWIAQPFLGNSFSEAVLANSSWLVNISGKTFLRSTATLPDPHMLAFFLNLSLGLNLAIIFNKKKSSFFWFLSSPIIFLAALSTFSRGGYLGLIIASLFLLTFLFINKGILSKLLVGCIFLSILVVAFWGPTGDRFQSSFNLKEGSNVGRIKTWENSWNTLKENYFLGTGIGSYPLYVKATAKYREPIYAHNAYLDVALDGGIGALISWLNIVFLSCLWFFRAALRDKFFLGLFFSLTAFAIHSFFETPIYSTSIFPLFLVIIGLAVFKEKKDEKNI